jgi:hypothetical protein
MGQSGKTKFMYRDTLFLELSPLAPPEKPKDADELDELCTQLIEAFRMNDTAYTIECVSNGAPMDRE